MQSKERLEIIAYKVYDQPFEIRAPQKERRWMDKTPNKFAYLCLPLVIANEMGWELLCPATFSAIWNGKINEKSIEINFQGKKSDLIASHFGSGVITFSLGYLFKTSPGHNLWVKGPANEPKDGIAPLDGVVETDWAPFTFTMNWKFTRPDHEVVFKKGEPICRIVPYPRDYINLFSAKKKSIKADREIEHEFAKWSEERWHTIKNKEKTKLRRLYIRGRDYSERIFRQHQTKIEMQDFEDTNQ